MKITVIIPNEEHRKSPGVRIRYERISKRLAGGGHSLSYTLIDDLRLDQPAGSDVYLFCKCQDIRSIIVADVLRANGKLVGADIFDDYFSQVADVRLTHIQDWFAAIAPRVDFFLCATEIMQSRLGRMAPSTPSHVLNDPLDAFDAKTLPKSLHRRLEQVRNTRKMEIAWFGTGDNPYFPVGLEDLAGFGAMLAEVRRHGYQPSLRVLTNRRAMTPQRLARLAKLPVPATLDDWTLEREGRALSECFAAFLPVNAQSFSTPKSLNRAITSLTRGAQVISTGFPLYKALEPFIYRSIDDLVVDLAQGRLRLRGETLSALGSTFARIAEPENETSKLLAFLQDLKPSINERPPVAPTVILHGSGNAALQHKFAQRSKMFSASSTFQEAPMNYDIKFIVDDAYSLTALVADRLVPHLSEEAKARMVSHSKVGKLTFFTIPLEGACRLRPVAKLASEKLAGYHDGMTEAQKLIKELIPNARIIVSETAAPFQMRPNETSVGNV